MAIIYTEKGYRMHAALSAAGLGISDKNGAWVKSNPAVTDDAINAFIAAYDALPDIKADRVAAIKADALARMSALFPALTSLEEIEFFAELWSSLKATAKQTTANFQKIIDIYSAAKTAIASVNAAADSTGVAAVVVVWP